MGYWAAGHGWLYILLADILPCCGEWHKNLFHLPAARIEVSWEQGKCSVCWTLGFDASPGVQRAVSVFTRDFWRCFLSRKVQFLIESNCSIWLTAVFNPKTFSAKIYCLEEALLTLFCIYQSMMISHSKTHLGVSGPSSFLQISLNISILNGIFVELLKDRIPQPDW